MKKSVLKRAVINIVTLLVCIVLAIFSLVLIEVVVGAPFLNWVDNCLGIGFVCHKFSSDPSAVNREVKPGGFSLEILLTVLCAGYYFLFRKFVYSRIVK